MRRPFSIVAVLFASLTLTVLLSGCVEKSNETAEIRAVVTILPQKEMVEAVGGDKVVVTVMIPPNQSPHTYAPTPSQMVEVSKADVYFMVGSGIEFETARMDQIKAQNPKMKVVNCSAGIKLMETVGPEGATKDPHVWLSPRNAKVMVQNIYDALVELDPQDAEYFKQNLQEYTSRLDALDRELRQLFEGKANQSFLVYHAAWAYFARDYGLREMVIEEGGKKPGPAGVAKIVEQAKRNGIHVVFVSPQFDQSSAKVIAREIGGRVVAVDPLAENYIENLRSVANSLAEGLGT